MHALSLALAFALAHQTELVALAAALVALGRAVEAQYGAAIAARLPRLAAAAAVVAHLMPDLVPAAKALAKVVKPKAGA